MAIKTKKVKDDIDIQDKDAVIKSKAYTDMLEQLNHPWEFPSQTDDELKTIAKDLFNDKIFCDRHLRQNDSSMAMTIFMPIMFIGHINWSTTEDRESKIIRILLEDKEKAYKERVNKYMGEIGMVYEYYGKELPRGVNGYPMFTSCRFLSKVDTERMLVFYNKYADLQKEIDDKL